MEVRSDSQDVARTPLVRGVAAALAGDGPLAVVVPRAVGDQECEGYVRGVYAARADWNADFAGSQFSLGRAFYTHLETERSESYFSRVSESDAQVQRALPGMQARMMALAAAVTGGHARARRGWCGAGVHLFPSGGEVARKGGERHFDHEGLSHAHLSSRRRALSLVVSLQIPVTGGGLRLWPARYEGRTHPTVKQLARRSVVVAYAPGDLCVFDSYRLHQIAPFGGARDRVSITLHAAEIGPDVWETWF